MSRTKKSFVNIIYNLINTALSMILLFVVRTVFIKVLGNQYLGLNGLMSNIISMLSLAELGIGTALIFKLYAPLAQNDEVRINKLMNFYKNAYRIVSLVIFIGGIITLPFLKLIIKGDTSFTNIYIVFIIYLFQAISSYLFFAYKSSLLIADQKEYIITRYGLIIELVSSFAQIYILVNYRSYLMFLLLVIFSNILKNILISIKVEKNYPYIDFSQRATLPEDEVKSLFNDFKALFVYKINNLVVKYTDNIIISSFLGLSMVGLYSNYLLITNSLLKLINPIFQSIKASLGNLYAEKGREDTYRLFKIVNLLTVIIYGGSSIGIFILSNHFITLWISEEFVISTLFSLIVAMEFYIRGMQYFLGHFRNVMGLFQQAKYRPIFGAIINLVLSIVLVNFIQINGVIIGTVISSLLTYMWYDPLIIHRYGFKEDVRRFYLINIFYVIVLIIVGYITFTVSTIIYKGTLFSFIGLGIITAIEILMIFFIAFISLPETKDLLGYFKRLPKSKNI